MTRVHTEDQTLDSRSQINNKSFGSNFWRKKMSSNVSSSQQLDIVVSEYDTNTIFLIFYFFKKTFIQIFFMKHLELIHKKKCIHRNQTHNPQGQETSLGAMFALGQMLHSYYGFAGNIYKFYFIFFLYKYDVYEKTDGFDRISFYYCRSACFNQF